MLLGLNFVSQLPIATHSPQPIIFLKILIDSKRLLTFVVVAESKNLATAATVLYVSRSAVSHSLKLLEEEMGCKLFERTQKSLLLTESGTNLLPQAKIILSSMDAACRSIAPPIAGSDSFGR